MPVSALKSPRFCTATAAGLSSHEAQATRRPKLEQGFLRVADHEFPGRGIHGIQQIVNEFVLNLEA